MDASPGTGAAARRNGNPSLHVLVLCDRDWTHPQGGGSGANLREQIERWVAWGHRVSVIAASYPGATRREQWSDRLTVHRFGGRSTVFPRAIWNQLRDLVPDADVVLEVINGITFLTPLWLRKPRAAFVNHRHTLHYREELGPRVGPVAGYALETLPISRLYARTPFIAVSQATRHDLRAMGIPERLITVAYNGVDTETFRPGRRASQPTLLYLGRVKRYKHVEALLDVLDALPANTVLEIAGDGDHLRALRRTVAERGFDGRVRVRGAVDEATKRALLRRAWVHVTASRCEGWSLAVMEAAACGTPSVALRMGGLQESILHGGTGLLASDDAELGAHVARLVADDALRERMGAAARERALTFSWDQMAAVTLGVLEAQCGRRNGRPHPVSAPARFAAATPTMREPDEVEVETGDGRGVVSP